MKRNLSNLNKILNVYIDPFSYQYLSNKLFIDETINDFLSPWRYLKKYCSERNINLNTIDFWNKEKANPEDIYVSLDHRNLITKLYWRFKNKNYPIVNLNNFKKRILFHGEPPLITPDIYQNINHLFKIYDQVYMSYRLDNPKFHHYYAPRPYSSVFLNLWENSNRKFLMMININKSPRNLKKLFTLISQGGGFQYFGYKEILSDRIKTAGFFSKKNELDLYGYDWDKRPFFPYWFYKKVLQKVYKGSVESKYQKLSEYKFAIAFENSAVPGYICEIVDCFYTGTIPIYLGDPDVKEHIPENCFIDIRNFKNYEELRSFLKSLTKSEIEAYRQNARKFLESEKFKPFTKEYFAKLFVEAISN